MLPKAKDCLGGNVAATSYQMLWNSKHGSAYLQADKTPWPPIPSGRRDRGGKNQKQSRFKKVQRPWTSETSEFLSSWILHAPAQLQASFVDWIENKRRPPLPLSSKSTSCVHGCPMMSLSLPDYHASLARKIRSYSTFIALRTWWYQVFAIRWSDHCVLLEDAHYDGQFKSIYILCNLSLKLGY